MMQLFSDYNFLLSIVSCVLLSIISSIVGLITIFKKESLLGDAISHASLPGVIFAFILTQQKGSLLLLGGFFAGVLASIFIKFIKDNTKIDFDSVLALILSSFFGLGMVLLTYVQKLPTSAQAGLKRYIFGQVAALVTVDMIIISIITLITLFLFFLFWKEIKLYVCDSIFAQTSGVNIKFLNFLIFMIITVVIIVQIQTVGLILTTAMLVSPGIAALQWSKKYNIVMLLSVLFGVVSSITGTIISFLFPNIPTGPAIIVLISLISFLSIIFGRYGYLYTNKNKKLHLLDNKEII